MKYAIYTRTACTEQKPARKNLQEQAIRNALKKGDKVYGVYSDDGISGNTLNRPALNKLRSEAKKGVFDGVFVTDIARLGRDLKCSMTLIDELLKKGLVIKTLTDEIWGAAGRLRFNIVKSLADFDRELRSERIKKGLRARKRKKK